MNTKRVDAAVTEVISQPVRSWKIATWVLIGLVLILGILIAVLFSRHRSADQRYKAEIATRDQRIQALTVEKEKAQLEADIQTRLAEDYLNRVNQNKTYYVTNQKKYDAVPVDVRRLTRDSLRREVAGIK